MPKNKLATHLSDFTFEQASEWFAYDPETGIVTWKVRKAHRIHVGDKVGTPNNEKYLNVEVNGRAYKVHRIAWLLHYGEWPKHCMDHINGDRSDNRACNLRESTRSQNAQNRKLNRDNKSGFIGVCRNSADTKWIALIGISGKQKYLGQFDTAEEASEAYKKSKRELHTFNPVAREPTRKSECQAS